MDAVKLCDFTFFYPGQSVPALSHVNLTVPVGSFFVLCGQSGSGKSTLLRHIKQELAPHGNHSGTVSISGSVGFVMQSPDNQLVTDTVWHELAFGMESHGVDSQTIRRRCGEMAAFFGLEELYHRKVASLSGGQKQLLCLAAVMTLRPDILVLDEPTAQLDPIGAQTFLSALEKLHRELGITVILSEHCLEQTLPMATLAGVMDGGELRFCGKVGELASELKQKKHPMFAAMPCAMRLWSLLDAAFPCPATAGEGRLFFASYFAQHPLCPLPERSEATCGAICVEASEVWFQYENNSPLLRDLNFHACEGELFALLGGNGSGKTTTLKLLSGIAEPQQGRIRRKGSVAYLPQDPSILFLKKTVHEDLLRFGSEEAVTAVAELCRIGHVLERHPYDLSGGEKQRAALAGLLLQEPKILLLDEPTKGLDVPMKAILAELLLQLKRKGTCIVMVSHDLDFCAEAADRCGLLFDGSLAALDTPRRFFAGNHFYTTAVNRMLCCREPEAVTFSDAAALCGVPLPEASPLPPAQTFSAVVQEKKSTLPVWRKLLGCLTAVLALCVAFYCAKTGDLQELLNSVGMTVLGKKQLLLYGIFLLFLIITAGLLNQKAPPSAAVRKPLSRRTRFAVLLDVMAVPVTVFCGIFYLGQRVYVVTALAVLFECMLPFLLTFEGSKPKAREIAVIATLCAIAAAGRAAFFMLPQFKPVAAVVILSGIALGGETGFLVGAMTMLVSNILFSQGPWTPWQMFAMGLIGCLAGVLARTGMLARRRSAISLFGAASVFVIYGGIMNFASAVLWGGEALTWKLILGYYLTGFPMDAIHAAATGVFLWFGAMPMLEKLDRIREKYGLMER